MRKLVIVMILTLIASVYLSQSIMGIVVKGNRCTKTFVVENLVGYHKGMSVNVEELERAQQRMLNSGLFSDVFMNLKATGDNYILIVDVRENPHIFPYFNVEKGVGIKNEDLFGLNLTARVSCRLFNLSPPEFLCGGYSLGLSSLRAFGTPISVNFEHSYLKRLHWQDRSGEFNYDLNSLIAGIGYTWSSNNFSVSYVYRKVPDIFSSSCLLFKFVHREHGNKRGLWNWSFDIEHALNSTYATAKLSVKRYYRIIAQIYSLTRFVGVYNEGDVPFLVRHYFGESQDLKGYGLREFTAPMMGLIEERIGIPLTFTMNISKSKSMTFMTPELIGQLAFVEDIGFKPSLGLGIKFKTFLGDLELQIFFGRKLAFYFESGF